MNSDRDTDRNSDCDTDRNSDCDTDRKNSDRDTDRSSDRDTDKKNTQLGCRCLSQVGQKWKKLSFLSYYNITVETRHEFLNCSQHNDSVNNNYYVIHV